MNNVDRKVYKLIEESINTILKNLLSKIGVIPQNILDKIKQKYRAKTLEEAVTPAPKISGKTNSRDTCYTAVMKLIGQERLIKKYDSSYDFIQAYHDKNPTILKLHDVKIKNVKPGTIFFYPGGPEDSFSTVNRGYGKYGIEQQTEGSSGHFEIYLGVDETKGNSKYVTLGNQFADDDRAMIGSHLELTLSYETEKEMNQKSNHETQYTEILDYNTIKKM